MVSPSSPDQGFSPPSPLSSRPSLSPSPGDTCTASTAATSPSATCRSPRLELPTSAADSASLLMANFLQPSTARDPRELKLQDHRRSHKVAQTSFRSQMSSGVISVSSPASSVDSSFNMKDILVSLAPIRSLATTRFNLATQLLPYSALFEIAPGQSFDPGASPPQIKYKSFYQHGSHANLVAPSGRQTHFKARFFHNVTRSDPRKPAKKWWVMSIHCCDGTESCKREHTSSRKKGPKHPKTPRVPPTVFGSDGHWHNHPLYDCVGGSESNLVAAFQGLAAVIDEDIASRAATAAANGEGDHSGCQGRPKFWNTSDSTVDKTQQDKDKPQPRVKGKAPSHVEYKKEGEKKQWDGKIRPDLVVVREGEDDAKRHARAIIEFKANPPKRPRSSSASDEQQDTHLDTVSQLMKYVVSVIGATPGFLSIYAMTLQRSQADVFRVDGDHITKIASYNIDEEPQKLYRTILLFHSICLDEWNGFRRYQRQIDVRALGRIFLRNGQDEEPGAQPKYRAITLQCPPGPATGSDEVTSWPYEFWQKHSVSHRITSVARVFAAVEDVDDANAGLHIPAIIKISQLQECEWSAEGDALRLLDEHRRADLLSTSDALRTMRERCYRGIPMLIAHGILWQSTQDADLGRLKLAYPQTAGPPRPGGTSDELGEDVVPFVVDLSNGLFTFSTSQRRQPTATLTKFVPSSALAERPLWMLPALIANVIEVIYFVCRPANIIHADISPGNIRALAALPHGYEEQLLDPNLAAELRPQLVLLIDFGESWTGDRTMPIGERDRRLFFSGTRHFWPRKAYSNSRTLGFTALASAHRHILSSLKRLDSFDDIESALLVLVYELVDRMDLCDLELCFDGLKRIKRSVRWRQMGRDSRGFKMGEDPATFADFLTSRFDDPRLDPKYPGEHAVGEVDRCRKLLSYLARTMSDCARLLEEASKISRHTVAEQRSAELDVEFELEEAETEADEGDGETEAGEAGAETEAEAAAAAAAAAERARLADEQTDALIKELVERLYSASRRMKEEDDNLVARTINEGLSKVPRG